MELTLPYPPSVNRYWRSVRGRVLVSRSGRAYMAIVAGLCRVEQVQKITGPVILEIEVNPPDNRRRDIDNVLKALLDALQKGGAYEDDSQVSEIHIRRGKCATGGSVTVTITRMCERET